MALGPGHVHHTRGEYRESERDRGIVFSWHCDAFADCPSLVTVSFEADQRGTAVTVLHEGFQSSEAATGQTMGWAACMDSLKAYLEQ